jgi:outer membrane receptor protein involved in Fe transport
VAQANKDLARLLYEWESPYGESPWSTRANAYGQFDRQVMRTYYPLDHLGMAANSLVQGGAALFGGGGGASLKYQKSYVLEGTLGGDLLRVESRNRSPVATPWAASHSVARASLFAASPEWRFASLSGELGYQLDRNHFVEGKWNGIYSSDSVAPDVWRSEYSARALVEVGPERFPVRGFASVGRAFRSPSPMELFGAGYGILPNPKLRPETGESVEAGARFQGKRETARLAFFVNRTRDRVIWLTSGALSKPFNFEATTVRGIELEYQSALREWLHVKGSATWQDPGNLPNEPEQSYFASLLFRLPYAVELRLDGEARSGVYRDKARREFVPAENFFHAWLSVGFWEKGKFTLGAQNLGGAEYQNIYSAYPTPGRTLTASMDWTL